MHKAIVKIKCVFYLKPEYNKMSMYTIFKLILKIYWLSIYIHNLKIYLMYKTCFYSIVDKN